MKAYLIAYIATAIAFLGLDAVWLSAMADRLYRPKLGAILLEKFQPMPAVMFYVIYVAGIVIFAVSPALSSNRWSTATIYGGLLGLCAYATYDLTNQATLKGWPIAITVADLCWGACVTAIGATAGYLAAKAFGGVT